jgi:thiamine biosynthesis lipoprotein
MGTVFTITAYAASEPQAEQAARAAFNRVARLEDCLSDYMTDSELSQLSKSPVGDPVPVSGDLCRLLERAAEISFLTDGAFDITAGPYTRLWRFARRRTRLPSADELAAEQQAVGWQKLRIDTNRCEITLEAPGMRLDPGGIAKGFAADEAMKVLRKHGIDRALIAAGGDVLASHPPPGTKGWTVRIRAPGSGFNSDQGAPRLLLRNAAVSTSGDVEQFVEIDGVRYSHIVSPLTGLGLTNRIQATVVAPDATTSDALATASCVLGPGRAVSLVDSLPGVSVLLLTGEGDAISAWRSQGAP